MKINIPASRALVNPFASIPAESNRPLYIRRKSWVQLFKVLAWITILLSVITFSLVSKTQNSVAPVVPAKIAGNSSEPFELPIKTNWYDPIFAYFLV